MNLPNFVHKFLYRAMRLAQRLTGASTVGVRSLVINDQQQVLLVKHTYVNGWFFPGGGMLAGETAKAAMLRELREETGVIALDEPQLFGVYFHVVHGVNDYPILYVIKKFEQHPAQSPEIAEINWFSLDALPADTTPQTKQRLNEYFNHHPISEYW